ncbi:hypothetical protein BDA99DRAFT_288407 [Phascolomyces articulosus]|uniref:Uncharacterized protein n=1 Tax=Phascolomyces articulosus TaxID=60185 RepID=A0AAD5K0B1_9FUNG|nr:hypothetical protein BDA99DRAFT_288407 [Phascolomyces articulosus]
MMPREKHDFLFLIPKEVAVVFVIVIAFNTIIKTSPILLFLFSPILFSLNTSICLTHVSGFDTEQTTRTKTYKFFECYP